MVLRDVPLNDREVPGLTVCNSLLAFVPTKALAVSPDKVRPIKVGEEVVYKL
jgi:hypothetical protein